MSSVICDTCSTTTTEDDRKIKMKRKNIKRKIVQKKGEKWKRFSFLFVYLHHLSRVSPLYCFFSMDKWIRTKKMIVNVIFYIVWCLFRPLSPIEPEENGLSNEFPARQHGPAHINDMIYWLHTVCLAKPKRKRKIRKEKYRRKMKINAVIFNGCCHLK